MWLGGAVVRALDLRLKGAGSNPSRCIVECNLGQVVHTVSSASGVTTLWRYINQFNFKKISACEWQKFLSAADQVGQLSGQLSGAL